MRLNVRLSAMTAMLCALVTLLMLAGSALSYFRLHQQRLDRQLTAMADSFDRLMLTEPLPAASSRLPVGHLLHRHAGQRCPLPACYRAG